MRTQAEILLKCYTLLFLFLGEKRGLVSITKLFEVRNP